MFSINTPICDIWVIPFVISASSEMIWFPAKEKNLHFYK